MLQIFSLQIVHGNLVTGVSKLLLDTKAQSPVLNYIVATHIAYKKYQYVFQNFHCITEVWPNIQENLNMDYWYIWRIYEEQVSYLLIQLSNLSIDLSLLMHLLEHSFVDCKSVDGFKTHCLIFIIIFD